MTKRRADTGKNNTPDHTRSNGPARRVTGGQKQTLGHNHLIKSSATESPKRAIDTGKYSREVTKTRKERKKKKIHALTACSDLTGLILPCVTVWAWRPSRGVRHSALAASPWPSPLLADRSISDSSRASGLCDCGTRDDGLADIGTDSAQSSSTQS